MGERGREGRLVKRESKGGKERKREEGGWVGRETEN